MRVVRRVALSLGAALVAVTAALLALRPVIEAEQRWQTLRTHGVLRVGIDPGVRPFSFYGLSGWEGVDADVAREAARRLGLRVEAVPVGYDGFYDALIAGHADVAMSALVMDPARTADFRYSRPYFDAGLRVIARPSLHLERLDDLRGRCVVAALGSEADRAARWLERRIPGMMRRAVADEADALTGLRIGSCEAAIVSSQAAIQAGCAPITDPNNAATVRCLDLRPVEYTIVMLRAHGRLASELDRVLSEMAADGTLVHIARQWLANDTTDTDDTNITNDTTQ